MPTFGEVVSTARQSLGLSQRQVAARVKKEDGKHISPQYLNDIERERRVAPSEPVILDFAKVLQLDPDYLCGLAQVFPADIHTKIQRSSPKSVHKAFRAFRKSLKAKK
jgi:transcriptional regulator with XRE-family HTH domain